MITNKRGFQAAKTSKISKYLTRLWNNKEATVTAAEQARRVWGHMDREKAGAYFKDLDI